MLFVSSTKENKNPIHNQDKLQLDIKKLNDEVKIQKLGKSKRACFIAPIEIAVNKDESINWPQTHNQ